MQKLLFIASLLVVTPAVSQDTNDSGPERSGNEPSPAAQMVRDFERSAPKVGDSLPQVRIWDDQGRPFDLGSLKGDYTVLVFGCLT